ncbi:ribonuclease D [Lichenibacterium minor]|jgi:ribonuclease D|uniref:Ribonuclease D n=1 Tax=Lichenibacterium minor TaxID=2316528 RepID=A0A4Q2U562_9HYPH|nr:ribonuclease D [Lichenibacterium minor]RYC31542.1 ribonuclease D [Lichenibacterium minor]
MTLITTTEELAAVCRRLARHPFVTVDTEFLRETTFWPKLCVLQLASDEEAVAVDALAPDIDLIPFLDLMADRNVVKVFHAARQDLEIVWKMSGRLPEPLFDTQVAAMVCGFGDQVSYSELCQTLCRVAIDKSSRFTDWARRPLTQAQVTYALADVTHLRDIYRALVGQLESSKRTGWLADEMRTLLSPATYEQHPDQAWERFRSKLRKPRDLAVMMDLAAWRESEAQTRDVPRSRILKDDAMIEVATAAPRSVDALGDLRAVPRGMDKSRLGPDMIAAVERGLARDPKSLPRLDKDRRGTGGGGNGATVELLKVLLRQVAEAHGVAAKLIANVDDLEAIAASDDADVPALDGWRRTMFGAKALDLKNGRLALTVEGGKVIALEWQDGDRPDA